MMEVLTFMVAAAIGVVVCSYILYEFRKEVGFVVRNVEKGVRLLSLLKKRKKKSPKLGVAS